MSVGNVRGLVTQANFQTVIADIRKRLRNVENRGLVVTDDVTTVPGTRQLEFDGATVTDDGDGTALVTIESGGGLAVTDGYGEVFPVTTLDFIDAFTVDDETGERAGIRLNTQMALACGVIIYDGTVYSGNVTAVHVTTGVYWVTSPSGFDHPVSVVSPLNAYGNLPNIFMASYGGQIDNQTSQIIVTDFTGALVDGTFSIIMTGTFDSPNGVYKAHVGVAGTTGS